MTHPGRPANQRARAAVLARLELGLSVREIARELRWSVERVRHYSRGRNSAQITAEIPAVPAGALLNAGARDRTTRGAFPNAPIATKPGTGEARRAAPAAPARSGAAAPRRRGAGPAVTAARDYAGVHDRRFTMRFATTPGKSGRIPWRAQRPLRGGIIPRHWTPAPGALPGVKHVQMTGVDSLTVTITLRPNRQLPLRDQGPEVDARALRCAEAARGYLERAIECSLSAPKPAGTAKHSVTGTVVGRRLHERRVTRGTDHASGLGGDASPEDGTVEIRDGRDVEAVVVGDELNDPDDLVRTRAQGRTLLTLRDTLEGLRAAQRADRELLTAVAQGAVGQSAMLRELLLRVAANGTPGAVTRGSVAEPRGTWGEGRAA